MSLLKLSRVPSFFKWCHPSWYVWDRLRASKTIYLTFDDGPIPEVTEFVLDTLSRKRASSIAATFFCIGDNVHKHPSIFKRILAEGHAVGNHTFNLLKGNLTSTETYIKNIHLAELEMAKHINPKTKKLSTTLFRPPYGRIKQGQAETLKKLGYDLIMYRVIAFDWDTKI